MEHGQHAAPRPFPLGLDADTHPVTVAESLRLLARDVNRADVAVATTISEEAPLDLSTHLGTHVPRARDTRDLPLPDELLQGSPEGPRQLWRDPDGASDRLGGQRSTSLEKRKNLLG
jgi:hypothetical protein